MTWGVVLAALAGLGLGALGPVSPELDVLANLRGHLLGLLVFAGLALALNYRPVVILVLGAFLTLATHAIVAQQGAWPLIGQARASTARPGDWMVLSLNTWRRHPDAGTLADQLNAAGADVLVLTEFGPNKIDQLHVLEHDYPYRQECAADWDCAIAVLSRHPFTSAGSVSSSPGNGPARVWITFGEGDNALTVMGVHAVAPLPSPRWHGAELEALADIVHRTQGAVVLAGDINTTPWTSTFSSFVLRSGLEPMGRFLPSYPAGSAGLPQWAIDHIFASPGIRFNDVRLGPNMGSNHLPVIAYVTLPARVQASMPQEPPG